MEYKFSLYEYSSGNEYDVTPKGFGECTLKYEHQEGQLFYRRIFSNPVVFTGNDWWYFKIPYDNNDICAKFDLIIEKRCTDTDLWVIDWYGSFSMMNGHFDFDLCTYTVTPLVWDKYSSVIKNGDTKINILKLGKTDLTGQIASILEFEFHRITVCNPPIGTPGTLGMEFFCCQAGSTYIYARESILLDKNASPTGSGWVEETNFANPNTTELLTPNESQKKYVRNWSLSGVTLTGSPSVVYILDNANADCNFNIRTPNDLGYTGIWYNFLTIGFRCPGSREAFWVKASDYGGIIFSGNETTYSGISLNSAIKYIFNQTTGVNESLVSDFLTNATNPVTGIASKTNHLYLIQNSDAKRPTASNEATIGEISFNELMEWLKFTFWIYWDIDSNGNIELFHVSEVSNSTGLDLSNYPTADHLLELDFDLSKLYEQEVLSMVSDGLDFKGLPIIYGTECIKTNNEANIQKYINGLLTDLAYVQLKVDSIADEGFTLVATDGTDIILEIGEISGANQLNGHLSAANLMKNYWQHERVLLTGTMNGVATTFQSAKKTKKFNEVTINLCCATDFNPEDLVITELGNGRVENAEYLMNTGELKLNLLL